MVKLSRTNEEWVKLFDAWRLIGLEVAVQGSNLGLDPERLRSAAVDDLNTRFVLALSLRDLKRTDEAIEHLDSILEADPDQLWPRYVRGVIQWNAQAYDAAQEDFLVLIHHPEFGQLLAEDLQAVSLYRYVASRLTDRGQTDEAQAIVELGRQHIVQYLEFHPGSPKEVMSNLWGFYHYAKARCLAVKDPLSPEEKLLLVEEIKKALESLPGTIPRGRRHRSSVFALSRGIAARFARWRKVNKPIAVFRFVEGRRSAQYLSRGFRKAASMPLNQPGSTGSTGG